jgi:2-oxo-4-hydroxy-4-carboxy--5-ureidoimidazoline (OHCU) decarboxylase
MLDQQRARLEHDRAAELGIAAEQQRQITHLRIDQTWKAD